MSKVLTVLFVLFLGACSADYESPAPGPEPVDRCENGGIPHPDYGCPPFGEPEPPVNDDPPVEDVPPDNDSGLPFDLKEGAPLSCATEPVPTTQTGEPCYGDWSAPHYPQCFAWRDRCLGG